MLSQFLVPSSECKFHTSEGVICKTDTQAWCFPVEHRCNDVDNCPDGSDEATEVCGMVPDIGENLPAGTIFALG